MRTNDPYIFAVGDCAEARCLAGGHVTSAYVPLGSTANKQGRVAAINICGGDEAFEGIYCTGALKVLGHNVALSGFTERQAGDAGFDVETSSFPGPDRAHYYPGAKGIILNRRPSAGDPGS